MNANLQAIPARTVTRGDLFNGWDKVSTVVYKGGSVWIYTLTDIHIVNGEAMVFVTRC